MPLATPKFVGIDYECEHCGAPVFQRHFTNTWGWVHEYLRPWLGQTICDPQLAREAKQERQPDHAQA